MPKLFNTPMEAFGIILAIGLVCLAILLALAVIVYGFAGAALQFAWAYEFGFVGVVVFFAAWVFMFPVMAIWAVIWGWIASRQDG